MGAVILRQYYSGNVLQEDITQGTISQSLPQLDFGLPTSAGNSEPFPQVVPEDCSPSPLEQCLCSDYTVTLLNQATLQSVSEASSKLASGA